MRTIDLKSVLLFDSFGYGRSQRVSLSGLIGVDLVDMFKFTQRVDRRQPVDTFRNKYTSVGVAMHGYRITSLM